jgi:hypothetical protein
LAPQLSLELVTKEIKEKLSKSKEDNREIYLLRRKSEKFDEIKREVNRNIIVRIIDEDIGNGLSRQ